MLKKKINLKIFCKNLEAPKVEPTCLNVKYYHKNCRNKNVFWILPLRLHFNSTFSEIKSPVLSN